MLLIECLKVFLKIALTKVNENSITKNEREFFDSFREKEKDPCDSVEEMFERWKKLAGL